MQFVFGFGRYPQLVALNGSRNFQFGVLDGFGNFLGFAGRDALLDFDRLFGVSAKSGFNFLREHIFKRNAALGNAGKNNVAQGVYLVFVAGSEFELVVFLVKLYIGIGSFKIVAVGNLFIRGGDGLRNYIQIHFGNDIKAVICHLYTSVIGGSRFISYIISFFVQ